MRQREKARGHRWNSMRQGLEAGSQPRVPQTQGTHLFTAMDVLLPWEPKARICSRLWMCCCPGNPRHAFVHGCGCAVALGTKGLRRTGGAGATGL